MAKLNVKQTSVTILTINDADFISLTDIAKFKTEDTSAVIGNWMRNRNTIEFLGIWETLYNPDFKPLEFEGFRKEAGLNAFTMYPKGEKKNIRDYATINELICLSNLENINAVLINENLPQKERLIRLNQIAIHQMKVLQDVENRKLLK